MTPAARSVCGAMADDRSNSKEDRRRGILQRTRKWHRAFRACPLLLKARLCPVATFPRNEPRKSKRTPALSTLVGACLLEVWKFHRSKLSTGRHPRRREQSSASSLAPFRNRPPSPEPLPQGKAARQHLEGLCYLH